MKDLCVIDWNAVAAWVQAIGSIGAIAVAIWIGNRQHKQNIELVEKERARVEARDAKSSQAVRDVARKAVAMVDEPLDAMRDAHRNVLDLVEAGKDEVMIQSAMEALQGKSIALHVMSKVLLAQFLELKPIYYAAGATQALCHYHMTSSVEVINGASKRCAEILQNYSQEEALLVLKQYIEDINEFHGGITENLEQL